MSTSNSFMNKMLSASLLLILCFLACTTNSLSTNTKTLEGIKTNLFQKLSNFPGTKMIEIKETISTLIEISKKPDAFESYQRNAFDILMGKVRDLVDDMFNEQQDEDVLFKNTSDLLMKYHLRQEHALEIAEDKFQLMQYFIDFVHSIEQTGGAIDVKTNYPKLLVILRALLSKFMEYKQFEQIFRTRFSQIYQDLKNSTEELKVRFASNQNPYKAEGLKIISDNLNSLRPATNAKLSQDFLYNVNPDLEMKMINKYIDLFEKESGNSTEAVNPSLFPAFEKEEKDALNEILVLNSAVEKLKENMKLSEDALNSNLKEYLANTKTRKDVINVIYQILELISKRSKKIKGYTLKYIENKTTIFDNYKNNFVFEKYKKYNFINITAEELINKPLPQLPSDVSGLEDDNAAVPEIKKHVPLNVNNSTVSNK